MTLRQQLDAKQYVLAPGAHDPLSAKAIQASGFDCVFLGGFAVSTAILGLLDLGLMTLTEASSHAGNVAQAVTIPVVADAENGFGGPLNAVRTVHMFERAGVAAIHIEDQVSPKRNAFMGGIEVIPRDDYVAKLSAAIEARKTKEFLLIARTDSYASGGISEVLERAEAARQIGADLLFVTQEPNMTAEDRKKLHSRARLPLMTTIGGPSPSDYEADLGRLGESPYKLVAIPHFSVLASLAAMNSHLARLHDTGNYLEIRDQLARFQDVNDLINLGQTAPK